MPKVLYDAQRRYPLGNAYCLVPIGRSSLVFREYAVKFPKGVQVHVDEEKTERILTYTSPVTGRRLLQRFYDLELKPQVFKWIKAKSSLETSHWLCLYPARYLVIVELSDEGFHAKDHLAMLFYRSSDGPILIAQQEYEGHLKGNSEYPQPSILQEELRDWRLTKAWYQDPVTRETTYEM